ncbi:MAG: rhodanese-like domain-containing protein [Saprospiraceae bacterium]
MKNTLLAISLLCISLFSFSACNSGSSAKSPYWDANVEQFKNLMEKNPDAVVLDVRTPQEFAEGNIPGAMLVDVNGPDFNAKVDAMDKNKKYLIYCRSGSRSVTACNAMADKGFKDLTNLLGGYQAWAQSQN